MSSRLLRMALVLVSSLTLAAVPMLAQGRGRGHDRDDDHGWFARHDRDDHDRHFDREDDHGRWRRDDDRDDFFFGAFGRSGRPPGWDRGRKTGWGNCDVPPGLAKKEGCGAFRFGRRGHGHRRYHRPVIVIDPRD